MFLVPAKTPGISVVRNNDIFLPHFLPNSVIHFEDVRVPVRYLVGEENKGWGYMWRGVYRQAFCTMSTLVGDAQALFEYVRDFTKQRIGGGKPIIEHGNVGPLVTEMAIIIEAARLLCLSGCWRLDQQHNAGGEQGAAGMSFVIDTTRSYVLQAMVRIGQLAAEVLGGLGATGEAPLEAFLDRTFGGYHGEGTPVFRFYNVYSNTAPKKFCKCIYHNRCLLCRTSCPGLRNIFTERILSRRVPICPGKSF